VEVENLRALMTDLRPPALDERGLAQALSDYVSDFRLRTNIICELSLDLSRRPDRESKTILYRVAQEALINAAKHSAATHVIVTCRTGNGRAEMSIVDNGIGFDLAEKNLTGMDGHLGLASIRERIEFAGGTCSIASAIGAGTSVAVSLELEGSDDGEAARLAG
jgi:signal transduction histidine kinase